MTTETPLVLTTDPAAFTPEYIKGVAAWAAEAIRTLNHATLDAAGGAFRFPADADAVLCELATLAQGLPQLCGQLATWLHCQQDAERIAVTYGPNAGDPQEAVTQATTWLGEAESAAGGLYEALNAARQITATMSAPYDPSEDPDA
jgi:hypothetical protein